MVALSVMLVGSMLLGAGEKEQKTRKPSKVIIGTYDSRAVKLAYDSATFAGLMPDLRVPKAIEFRQGFGTGDVSEYLDQIRDESPRISQNLGVDVIVSKWDIEYHDPNVAFVNVTEALIQPFKPTEERMKIIRALIRKPPISEKEIRQREAIGKEI
jgi:hypothetical protein